MTQSTRFTSFVIAALLAASSSVVVVNAGTEKTIAPTATVVGTPRPTDYPTVSPTVAALDPSPSPPITTPAPTTDAPVTAAPTPCGNRLFYIVVIDSVTKCSNGYDTVIASPDIFATSSECCDKLTEDGSLLLLDADDYCKVVDVCNPTDAPTDSPTTDDVPTPSPVTDEPTPSPVSSEPTDEPTSSMVVVVETTPSPITPAPTVLPVTVGPTPCEGRLYYIITDIDGMTTCSNGMDNAISILDTFASVGECCDELVNLEMIDCNENCNYIDICNPTVEPTVFVTPAPTPCGGRKFYTTKDSGLTKKCSNAYDETLAPGTEIFDTVEECCEVSFEDVTNCKVVDVCNPTVEPTPSPSLPPVTSPTLPPVPEVIVTFEPTFGSSPQGSGVESSIPTVLDTPAPTPCEGRKWYLTTSSEGDGTTTCTNGYGATINGATTIYDTFLECCEAEGMVTMDSIDCKYIDVCNPPAPTPAPIDVTPEPTIVSSIGSTPTVGKEMESGYINLGPRH